jgi:DNA-binding CsgD family transcriptional regulator
LRVAPSVFLSEEQEHELTGLSRSGRTSVRLAQRASIVLLAAQGLQNKAVAEQMGIGRVQVTRWRER